MRLPEWRKILAGLVLVAGLSWGLSSSATVPAASASRLGAGLGVAWVCWVLRRRVWHDRAPEAGFEQALRPPGDQAPVWPSSYAQLRRTVDLACSRDGAHAVEYRLQPVLRELASQRLASRRGIDLATQPEPALALLGADLFALVSRDQAPPAQRLKEEPGVPLAQLEEWLARLAAI